MHLFISKSELWPHITRNVFTLLLKQNVRYYSAISSHCRKVINYQTESVSYVFLLLRFMYSYCYVYVFSLTCMHCSVYSLQTGILRLP